MYFSYASNKSHQSAPCDTKPKQKNLRVSILLAAYDIEECTLTVSVEFCTFVHMMNQINFSSTKQSKNRGHKNKIRVFSCLVCKNDNFYESKISFTF